MIRAWQRKQCLRADVRVLFFLLGSLGIAQVAITPLTDLPQHANVDLSPDGKQIVYSSDSGLLIRGISGGTAHQLVSNDGDALASSPRWSPDGKWVAFTYSDSIPDERLYLKSVGGGPAKFVTRLCTRNGAEFAWTPDSTALVIPLPRPGDDSDPPCRLSVLDVSTARVSRFLALGRSPAVSPDGKTMAFVRDHEIRILPLSSDSRLTTRDVMVAREPREIGVPVWTKDGAALLYSMWGECDEVHRVAARPGATPIQVIDIPTGIQITGSAPQSQIVMGNRSVRTITRYTLDLQAARPEFVAGRSTQSREQPPARSPDGNNVAYMKCSMGASEILAARSDGSGKRVLVGKQSAPVSEPMWSPDGRSIAFTAQPGSLVGHGDFEEWLYVVPAAGGQPKRLLPGFYSATAPWWSRDSQIIYFTGAKDGQDPFPEHLWSVRVSDGELTQLTNRECSVAYPSPDRSSIYCYYFSYVPHIFRVLTTGEEQPELSGGLGSAPFLAGSAFLYFISGGNALLQYDLRNGSSRQIAAAPSNSRLESLSADGRVVTAATYSTRSFEPVILTGLR